MGNSGPLLTGISNFTYFINIYVEVHIQSLHNKMGVLKLVCRARLMNMFYFIM